MTRRSLLHLTVLCLTLLLLAGCTSQLMVSARDGDMITVRRTLREGFVYVDARNTDGDTALTLAAKGGHAMIVKELIDSGADPYLANFDGDTPLSLAEEGNHIETENIIRGAMGMELLSPYASTKKNSIVVAKADTTQAALDTTPPEIEITSHAATRGIQVTASKKILVEGIVSDESGIFEVLINGEEARVAPNGKFSKHVRLGFGENDVNVVASDTKNNTASKKFKITREGATVALNDTAKKNDNDEGLMIGNYYALIIGNNNYKLISNLNTPINDAKVVKAVLESEYGFEAELLLDATRADILRAMTRFRKKLKDNDNFLLYYGGHGVFDKSANKAYWLPVDAESDDDANWIIVDDITAKVRRMAANHVLIVSDSCYSGTMTRALKINLDSGSARDKYLTKMLKRGSRTLLASGGNEPVSDSGGKGHSIFADSFIYGLKNMEQKIFTADELVSEYIIERVAGNSDQVPEYNNLRNSGHDGGDFLFMRK